MLYRNRLVRGLVMFALLAGMLAGPAGRFLLTALAREGPPPAAPDPATEGVVVISEFRTRGPGGGADEFIELYNRGTRLAYLVNWSIRISNSKGWNFELVKLPYTALSTGQHYLIANPAYTGGSVPDRTWSSYLIPDDAGIALIGDWRGVIDQVGMSSGSVYKEGTPLPPLIGNIDQSYERRPGGTLDSCQDSGDNSADFSLLQPGSPQNTANPLSLCGVGMQDTAITLNYDIPDPSVSGEIVNVYYSVASASGTPAGGQVRVSAGSSHGCEGRLDAGQGGCQLLFGDVGPDSLVAAYSGYGIFRASTSIPEPHQVDRADTVTKVTWDKPDPTFKGEPVVIRFSVEGVRSDVSRPTGDVIVSTGWISCRARLVYGVGQCTLTFMGIGEKKITAAYLGDANYTPSTSQVELHTVIFRPANTSTPHPRITATPTRLSTRTSTPNPGFTTTPTPSRTITPTFPPGCAGTVGGIRPPTTLAGARLPDLAVEWMGSGFEHPGCRVRGDTFGLRVGIANIGPARTGSFVVRMDKEERVVDGMDPNSKATLFFRHFPYPYACVMLDSTDAVHESDETNNLVSQQIPVPTAPLPCIAPSLTPSPMP